MNFFKAQRRRFFLVFTRACINLIMLLTFSRRDLLSKKLLTCVQLGTRRNLESFYSYANSNSINRYL